VTTRPYRLAISLSLVATAIALWSAVHVAAAASSLPARLSDAEFWTLISDLSEPSGTFRSENLLSNETRLQFVIPDLVEIAKPGGVYVGVGPEQNFTYIAAIKPAIAFIVDIRRGNLDLHLMYKALFELSADRADFVARLFSRRRPAGLRPGASAADIFSAYLAAEPSAELYERNLKEISRQLESKHGFALTAADVAGIEHVYRAFFEFGPSIQYSSSDGLGGAYQPTYVDLMVATDIKGRTRSYLASDEAFAAIRDLQSRNMIVPVVGNFAGPKALRAVGAYLKERNRTVSVFYLSNVEQYLRLQRAWNTFCANVAALPLDDVSTFVRAGHGGRQARGTAMTAELGAMSAETESCSGR